MLILTIIACVLMGIIGGTSPVWIDAIRNWNPCRHLYGVETVIPNYKYGNASSKQCSKCGKVKYRIY